MLATDALITGGGELADLSSETMQALNALLPREWSHGNPIDILGDATPERYAKAIEIVAKDPNTDGLLVVLTPQAMTDPTQIAEQLKPYAKLEGKPLLASWMGGTGVAAGEAILNRAGIPTFAYPDTAARIFHYMWRYSYNLRGLYETPQLPTGFDEELPSRAEAEMIIAKARQAGRTILTEAESKQLLTAYGIPTVETRVATQEDESRSVRRGDWLSGRPQAAFRDDHPQDRRGRCAPEPGRRRSGSSRLSCHRILGAREGRRRALPGSDRPAHDSARRIRTDRREQYRFAVRPGPPIWHRRAVGGSIQGPGAGAPPTEYDAGAPHDGTDAHLSGPRRSARAEAGGFGGAGASAGAVQFSGGGTALDQEIDINPLLASAERLIALDARVILHPPEVSEAQLPKLAVRPYPTQYVWPWTMKDGTAVTIRPLRPEDEPLMVKFHERLSERSVYMRYFHMIALGQRTAHERMVRICFIDFDREIALVADRKDPRSGEREILAAGRLTREPGTEEAQFSV